MPTYPIHARYLWRCRPVRLHLMAIVPLFPACGTPAAAVRGLHRPKGPRAGPKAHTRVGDCRNMSTTRQPAREAASAHQHLCVGLFDHGERASSGRAASAAVGWEVLAERRRRASSRGVRRGCFAGVNEAPMRAAIIRVAW